MPKQKTKTQEKIIKAKTRGRSREETSSVNQTAIDQADNRSRSSQQKPKRLVDFLKDRPVLVNSVGAGLLGFDQGSVLREMQKARFKRLSFYTSEQGGSLPIDEAVKLVDGPEDEEYAEQLIAKLLSGSVENVTWNQLQQLYQRAPNLTKKVWHLLKNEARNEFENGHRAAKVFEPVHWLEEPWRRGQYQAIRESFIEQWKPQGGIELAMIDMLTQSFYLYLYWTEVAVKRTQTQMRTDPPQWVQERAIRDHSFPREREHGWWDPPLASEVEAADHASAMADRYQRAFQRTLRAMRDLRRYSSPVTINNPQQVNIAADGGQQINAVKK